MKKKLLASLLSLAMVFSMMPTTVYAENDAATAVQEETTEQELEEAAAEEDISDAEEPASEVTEASDETEEQPTETPTESASEETEETTETENTEDMETTDVVSDEPAEQNTDEAGIAVQAEQGDFGWGSSENSADNSGDINELSAAISAATEPVYVKLNGDVTAPYKSVLRVPAGKTVYLDLAGHTLYSDEGRYGNYLIYVTGGELHLTDSSAEKTGTISVGKAYYVIRVEDKGTFILDGGKVTKSDKEDGRDSGLVFIKQSSMIMNDGILTGGNYISNGAVVLNEGGQFTMNGGEIRDNTSTQNSVAAGAGIYMAGTTSFTMNGGSISNNTTNAGSGAAVSASKANATIAIHGGTISNNHARLGGAIYFKGMLLLDEEKGTLLIQNNTANDNGGAIYADFGNQTILMKGGTISGNVASTNTAYGCGGAVYCRGIFTMTGGQITDNTSLQGAVYVQSNSTFNMAGGKISDNIETGKYQKGAGLYTNSSSIVNIGGSAEISGNKLETPNANEAESNIYDVGVET